MLTKFFCFILLALTLSANVIHYHYHFNNAKTVEKHAASSDSGSYNSFDCMMDCYDAGET